MASTVAARTRLAAVLDVAYGRLETAATSLRIGALVAAIDAGSVPVAGRWRSTADGWASAVAEVIGHHRPDSVTIAHPSTWGRRRVAVVLDAVETVVGGDVPISVRPRAVVLAETHLESSVQACIVLEAHGDRLDVHRLQRSVQGWQISRTTVVEPGCPPEELAATVDDAVEVVLVDGDHPDRVAAALDLALDATSTGRVAAVDRALLHRFAAPRESPPGIPPIPPAPRPGPVRIAAAVSAVVVVVAVLVGIAVWSPGGRQESSEPGGVSAQIARVTLVVPAGWRRTSDPPDATGAVGFTSIAAPDDDRRILVVENAVRVDSTLDTVATSLRNRLTQRGTESVTEFSADTTFAGRRVISYRETPGSGAPIRWYVVVSSALQVSIGCQPGTLGESIDEACAAAVGSVAIAPL